MVAAEPALFSGQKISSNDNDNDNDDELVYIKVLKDTLLYILK